MIRPTVDRRLGNSPKTRDDGAIPSGSSVSFISFPAKASRTCRCNEGWSNMSLLYAVVIRELPVPVAT